MFTPQELRTLLAFLERVQLQGNEAVTFVQLANKIATLLNQLESDTIKTGEKKDSQHKKRNKKANP